MSGWTTTVSPSIAAHECGMLRSLTWSEFKAAVEEQLREAGAPENPPISFIDWRSDHEPIVIINRTSNRQAAAEPDAPREYVVVK